MTKGELYTYISQYLENQETSFVDNRDLFVRLAEEDICRQVQLPELRKNSTSTFNAGVPYLGLPPDFLSAYSLAVIVNGEYQFLTSKEVAFIREVFPDPNATGIPRYFAQFDDDSFIIGPTPADNYQTEMHFFYRPESISTLGDGETTWLSENAENALLFGAILQGYIYMKGDQDVLSSYQKKYDTAIADLKTIAEGRNRKDSYRNIDRRLPV